MSDDRGVIEKGVGRVLKGVVPPVVDSIDVNGLIEEVDVNALLERIDIDTLLANIDVNQLMSRIDVNQLVSRVDVNVLLDGLDVNAVLDRVDVDRMLANVDLESIMRRANIGEIVAESTGQVAGSALDLARRQVVGLDVIIMRFINGVMRRDANDLPVGPPLLNPPSDAVAITQVDPAATVAGDVS